MMMKLLIKYSLISAIVFSFAACTTESVQKEEFLVQNEAKIRLAFGSCAHSYDTLNIFDAINGLEPDVWIWLGDIVYGDTHDMDVLKEKYDKQKAKPQYQKLLTQSEVIGTWDDHDYGINDGGKYYSMKKESKEVLLDFLDVDNSNPMTNREGVYSNYSVKVDDKIIKVLLLDTRYFRDTLSADTATLARYLPNLEGDILGKEQWEWLQRELSDDSTDLFVIGSSIQLIAEEQGFEKWDNFPAARNRFFEMLTITEDTPVFIISGDRHMAEMSKINLDNVNYPLYDLTASGLTHTWGMYRDEANQYREGDLIVARNFGMLDIEFVDNRPVVRAQVINEEGKSLLMQTVQY